ncbi:unnamed protein product [Protopolystoma xenopodis]|uniref:Protein kinase domain-containing protein n=1 Tax=Protopolystoma xenopodis TaxID=117903 RepID=A0A3S5BV74_9PLAT|nr:unnamed protein product [Protopolystoma xenopodis]
MASVDHPCCVRFLAFCMTARPQLITQFLPMGCLLDHLHHIRLGCLAVTDAALHLPTSAPSSNCFTPSLFVNSNKLSSNAGSGVEVRSSECNLTSAKRVREDGPIDDNGGERSLDHNGQVLQVLSDTLTGKHTLPDSMGIGSLLPSSSSSSRSSERFTRPGFLVTNSRRPMPKPGVMMTWCQQIASGMAYLASRGIIHRDLAARNVLMQTEHWVSWTWTFALTVRRRHVDCIVYLVHLYLQKEREFRRIA